MTLAPCPFFCTAFQVIHTPAAAPNPWRASTTCQAPFQGVGIQERVHSPKGDERSKQMVPTSLSSAGESRPHWAPWGTEEDLHPAGWDSSLLRHGSQPAAMMGNTEIASCPTA